MNIFGIGLSDVIAALSLAIACITALVGGLYTVISSTKKYELSEDYKKELISWYSQVSFVIEEILASCEEQKKKEALGKLSALIDIGRMYFPNVIRNDGFGDSKPSAHQGYRHIALDYLVWIYEISKIDTVNDGRNKIINIKKYFNSVVFDIVAPRSRLKKLKIYGNVEVPLLTREDIFGNE